MTIPAIPTPRHGGDALTGHIMTDAEKRNQDFHTHWVYRFGVTKRHFSLAEKMITGADPVELAPIEAVIAGKAMAAVEHRGL